MKITFGKLEELLDVCKDIVKRLREIDRLLREIKELVESSGDTE
jgi:hypothetical protein